MTDPGDISRRAQAWGRQLRAQGLRLMDADHIAHAEARQQVAELEERLAAADPARWYGPGSPEAREDPAVLVARAEQTIARHRAAFDQVQRLRLAEAQARRHPPPAIRTAQPQASPPEPEAHL